MLGNTANKDIIKCALSGRSTEGVKNTIEIDDILVPRIHKHVAIYLVLLSLSMFSFLLIKTLFTLPNWFPGEYVT